MVSTDNFLLATVVLVFVTAVLLLLIGMCCRVVFRVSPDEGSTFSSSLDPVSQNGKHKQSSDHCQSISNDIEMCI